MPSKISSSFNKLEIGLKQLGRVKGKSKFIDIEVAVSMGSYMKPYTGTSGKRIAGYKLKGKEMSPLAGGVSVQYQKMFQEMLELPVKEFVQDAEQVTAEVMVDVLATAVDLAPYWFPVTKKTKVRGITYYPRPFTEGQHLRESGAAWIGAVGSNRQLIGYVHSAGIDIPTSSNVRPVPISFQKGKKYRAKTNFYVEFFRLSPKGWDVAMWTHENLTNNLHIGQPKYLETAFAYVQPKKVIAQKLTTRLAKNTNYSKLKNKQKTALKQAVDKAVQFREN